MRILGVDNATVFFPTWYRYWLWLFAPLRSYKYQVWDEGWFDCETLYRNFKGKNYIVEIKSPIPNPPMSNHERV